MKKAIAGIVGIFSNIFGIMAIIGFGLGILLNDWKLLKYLLISVAFFGIFALLAYALVYFRKKGGRTATLLNLMWMFMEWLKPHLLIGFAGLITIKLFENIQPLHIVSRHSDTLGWIGEFLESIFAIYFIGLLFTVGYGFIFTYWMFQKRSKEKGNDK